MSSNSTGGSDRESQSRGRGVPSHLTTRTTGQGQHSTIQRSVRSLLLLLSPILRMLLLPAPTMASRTWTGRRWWTEGAHGNVIWRGRLMHLDVDGRRYGVEGRIMSPRKPHFSARKIAVRFHARLRIYDARPAHHNASLSRGKPMGHARGEASVPPIYGQRLPLHLCHRTFTYPVDEPGQGVVEDRGMARACAVSQKRRGAPITTSLFQATTTQAEKQARCPESRTDPTKGRMTNGRMLTRRRTPGHDG